MVQLLDAYWVVVGLREVDRVLQVVWLLCGGHHPLGTKERRQELLMQAGLGTDLA